MTEIDAVRSDGRQVHIRPVRSDDVEALGDLVDRVSDRTIYLRFFSLDRVTAHRYVDELAAYLSSRRRGLVARVGDELVAVAGYDRVDDDSAELALLIDDRFHGEGIGTLMLEYLVSMARRDGIRRFIADVLLENTAVITVLRDLGYELEMAVHSGEARLVCTLDPDENAQAAVDERDRIAAVNSLRPVLAPRSIAVVGASSRPRSVGRELLHTILVSGFTGPVYPVNPRYGELLGLPTYASPADLPDAPDLAVIAVPSAAVADSVRACGERGVRGIVLVTSGFREVSGDGAAREAEVLDIAREYGMRLIGPNCLGIMNTDPAIRLDATFTPLPMRPGGFGLASQSGALGIAVVMDAARAGLGLSQFVSLGNKADVSGNDLLHWWADDPHTSVIGLYLESFGNPRKFARLGRRVSRRKPVLAIKSGRSDAGQRAGLSHTAAAATSDNVIDALCAQAGVLRVDTIEQFIDAARVLDSQPLPRGPRVAIVGNSGGPEILAADAAATAGLVVPELSAATVEAIRKAVPSVAGAGNPVDLGGGATPEDLAAVLEVVLGSAEVDAVLVVVAPTMAINGVEADEVVWERPADIPVVVIVLGTELEPVAGRPVPFQYPEPAAATLGLAWRYAQSRGGPPGRVSHFEGLDDARARRALAHPPAGGWLEPDAAVDLLGAYGIPVSRQREVTDAEHAVSAAEEFGYPVVLKAVGVLHKTDVGGVQLDLRNADEVRHAFESVAAVSPTVLVQPMAAPGVELIVGAMEHPQFGALVMVGAGGVFADLLPERSFRLAPMTDVDAAAMVEPLRGPVLEGYRGSAPASESAIRELVERVSLLVTDHPEIVELDLNPVIATGDRLLAVDAKVRVGTPPPLPDPLTRRLQGGALI